MTPRLSLEDVAGLLKTEPSIIETLITEGRLHGVVNQGVWSTTREILEGDLELLTEAARIDRLKAGTLPAPPAPQESAVWFTRDWVAASLSRVRASARE